MTKIEEARAIDHDPQWKYRTSITRSKTFKGGGVGIMMKEKNGNSLYMKKKRQEKFLK